MLLHNTAHESSSLIGVLLQEKIRSKRVVVESELMVDGVNGQFLSADTAARNVSGISGSFRNLLQCFHQMQLEISHQHNPPPK